MGKITLSVCLLILALLILPAHSWEYNDGTPSDTSFETFGSRADRLLIKFYNDKESMWDALETGQIDMTDWELDKIHYDRFMAPPYNNTVNVISSGADGSFYILDINNNNNEFLGNPPDPAYPNPVYPNPCSVLGMRKAIAYLCDRNYIINNITSPFGYPLYTPLLPISTKFMHPDIQPGGLREDLCYLYSREMANVSLDSSGFAEKDAEGWRIWDVTGQRVELDFWIRDNDPARKAFGDFLASELEAVGVKVQRTYYPIVKPLLYPAGTKDFHLNTGGWMFDMDPDCLLVWHWSYYWHPGRCLDYAGCNDPIFNEAVDAILNTVSPEEAVAPAYLAQERFAEMVLSVPLWCSVNYQAVSRRYVGTPSSPDEEDIWEGQYWEGMSRMTYIDNRFSFLNMHPQNHDKGDGSHMTIRYGFSTSELVSLNPIYAEWVWDNKVLDLMYESLLERNPYNINEFVPWLAKTYKMDTYTHPTHGKCTKVTVTLRPNIYWSDGTPVTTADVYFTLVEMDDILEARFTDPIMFCPWLDSILSFKVYDPYNLEILLNAKDAWVAGRICTSRILPKHIWEPICRTGDPTTFAPDPNFVASGPWRLKEYVASSHVELVRNNRGSTIQTNLPGSTPTTSLYGYFRGAPLEVNVHGDDYKGRFPPKSPLPHQWLPVTINFTVTLSNLWYGGNLIVDKYLYVDDMLQAGYPVTDISLEPLTSHEERFNLTYERCKHSVRVAAYIKEPASWAGEWVNATLYFWVTLVTDIYGDYFYDPWLRAPNCKVDMGDLGLAANAFGAYPGHQKWGWNCFADVNNDYKVDMKDIALIAKDVGFGM